MDFSFSLDRKEKKWNSLEKKIDKLLLSSMFSMFFEYREKFKKRLIARQISDFEKYFEF